jgi:hypothetical protein
MKKVIVKTVPSYKWVIEDLCSQCEGKCERVAVQPGAVVPPPPKVADAKLLGFSEADVLPPR